MKLEVVCEDSENAYHFQCSDCSWDWWVVDFEDIGIGTYDVVCQFLKEQGWTFGGGWYCSDCSRERLSNLHHECD